MTMLFDNIKHNKEFEKVCMMTQKELKNHLKQKLNMQSGDGWLYREGTFPVLLTAHMDTVHQKQCRKVKYMRLTDGREVITSNVGIGGDDRCGIYMIQKMLEKVDCSVLFCEDEEIGSVGAGKFVKTDLCESLKGKFKYIIELDRANSNDAVFYDDENDKFHDFVTKEFYKETWGSWSDICTLSPVLEISSVNLSCGYYKAHTVQEYVVLSEMERSIEEAIKLLNRTDVNAEPFEFIERRSYVTTYIGGRHSGYSWYDKYDAYGYGDYYGIYNEPSHKGYKNESSNKSYEDDDLILEVITADGDYIDVEGNSVEECWMNFFMEYPMLCFNDVCDYHTWHWSDYYYTTDEKESEKK